VRSCNICATSNELELHKATLCAVSSSFDSDSGI
jgi:hypothetical protein